ncbi:hypothetical protein EG68_02434 [Paragonimus skrjabini miyazakii]|uniref:Uncharacterized protein n=1 Tax=Paragonimus skrjabini miyazakii TaxID=59628 RepID=A0A8S9Z0R9_9TREM|nr:hypothetical protein EG68_02434 [Paragonimus skrjabini miyazakii]
MTFNLTCYSLTMHLKSMLTGKFHSKEYQLRLAKFLDLCDAVDQTFVDMCHWFHRPKTHLEHFARYMQLQSMRMRWSLRKWHSLDAVKAVLKGVTNFNELIQPFVPHETDYIHGLGAMKVVLKMEQAMYHQLCELYTASMSEDNMEIACFIQSTALPSHSRYVKYAQNHVVRLARLYGIDEANAPSTIQMTADSHYDQLTMRPTITKMLDYFYNRDRVKVNPPNLNNPEAFEVNVDMSWIMS